MLKLNPIFLCAICIFSMRTSACGIPLIDEFKEASVTEISNMLLKETTPDDFKIETNDSKHEYTSRDLKDDENEDDYTEIVADDFLAAKPVKNTSHLSTYSEFLQAQRADLNSHDEAAATKPKKNTSSHGKNNFSTIGARIGLGGTSALSANTNNVDIDSFGNKIFLFNGKFESGASSSFFNKKETKDKKSFFLFDDDLPNLSES